MELRDFAELEKQIDRILDRVNILQKENEELHQRLNEAQTEFQEKSAEVEILTRKLAAAEANSRDMDKEAQVRTKITSLLDKLEGF